MPKKLTPHEAQIRLNLKFPQSGITITEFKGTEYPCTLQHPEFGVATFCTYASITRYYKDTSSLHRAIQRKGQGLGYTKPLHDVQSDFNAHFPDSNITIVDYLGSNRGGVLYHPDYGNLRYSQYSNLFLYGSPDELLKSLSTRNLNRLKELDLISEIHSLSSDTSLSDSDFRQQVIDLLNN